MNRAIKDCLFPLHNYNRLRGEIYKGLFEEVIKQKKRGFNLYIHNVSNVVSVKQNFINEMEADELYVEAKSRSLVAMRSHSLHEE